MLCWETEDDNSEEPAGPREVFKALIKSSTELVWFVLGVFLHYSMPVRVPG